MSASERIAETGTGVDARPPVDVLYLDRPRLNSYASQLYEGSPIQRHIRDWMEEATHDTGPQLEEETSTSSAATGSAGLKLPIELSGSSERTSSSKQLRRGQQRAYQTLEGADEHTILETRDNLLVALLEDLRHNGWLRPYDPSDLAPGLFEVRAAMQFFDWSTVQSILNGWSDLIGTLTSLGNKLDGQQLTSKNAKTISNFTKSIGLSGFHLQMSPADAPLTAALALEHLTITREQMMVTYLRNEPVVGTLIAYRNPSVPGLSVQKPPILSAVKFGGMLNAFVGDSERVLPLAIYFPIDPPRSHD